MTKRIIDNFDVILLDMGLTFMFGVDRFGDNEDYHATYRQIGGKSLSAQDLRVRFDDLLNRMYEACYNPARYDDFGDVRRFLTEPGPLGELPPTELELLIEVFARHEAGHLPADHANALRQLAASHPLGVVSNVWAPSCFFEQALTKAGVRDLFGICVWSSDCLSIKPSPLLFQKALSFFGADPACVLFVGDNPQRDIAGAKGVGMKTVWIENENRPLTPDNPQPDFIIANLTELPDATVDEIAVK
jgi:putative hydrolase of the HAD superfamily